MDHHLKVVANTGRLKPDRKRAANGVWPGLAAAMRFGIH